MSTQAILLQAIILDIENNLTRNILLVASGNCPFSFRGFVNLENPSNAGNVKIYVPLCGNFAGAN